MSKNRKPNQKSDNSKLDHTDLPLNIVEFAVYPVMRWFARRNLKRTVMIVAYACIISSVIAMILSVAVKFK